GLLKTAINNLILLLAPFAPHICEEMWEHVGNQGLVYRAKWPSYDEKALIKDEVEVVVQINGKVKEKLNMPAGLDKAAFEKTAMETDKIKQLLEGNEIVKIIAVPDKLINIVIK
ncbi:MAG: class I tRNA ligase family protein, partial [Clostridiales bacterium]|nr:class I tRNA ligase family protein [Clostridiales bacterium]